MKRLTLFSLLSLFASSTLLAQELTFTETSHDFGAINEADGEVHHDFTLPIQAMPFGHQASHYRMRLYFCQVE